jgi:hypothetical protein
MKSIRNGMALFVWVAALAIAGSGSTLAQGPRDGEHPDVLEGPSGRPPDRQLAPAAGPFARLQLPNGDTLSFYELTGRDMGRSRSPWQGRNERGTQARWRDPRWRKRTPWSSSTRSVSRGR